MSVTTRNMSMDEQDDCATEPDAFASVEQAALDALYEAYHEEMLEIEASEQDFLYLPEDVDNLDQEHNSKFVILEVWS